MSNIIKKSISRAKQSYFAFWYSLDVKLTSTQLVGDSIAEISMSIEAISKVENVDYYRKGCQKVLFYLYENGFFQTRKQRPVKIYRSRSINWSSWADQSIFSLKNQSIIRSSINHQSTPRNQSSHRRLPVRYNRTFVYNAYSWLI